MTDPSKVGELETSALTIGYLVQENTLSLSDPHRYLCQCIILFHMLGWGLQWCVDRSYSGDVVGDGRNVNLVDSSIKMHVAGRT